METRWGKALSNACSDFKEAGSRIDEMGLRIQVCWTMVLSRLEVAKELESTMSDDHKHLQQRTLFVLQGKLEVATLKLSKLATKPGPPSVMQKLKFVLLRETLGEAISELESWQKLYEPCWFQLIKLAPPSVDVVLNSVIRNGPKATVQTATVARKFRRAFKDPAEASGSLFISDEVLSGYTTTEIPFCLTKVATCPRNPRRFLIDKAAAGAVDRNDAREFAFRLRDADPATFGLLSCRGVVRSSKADEMAFLLRVPDQFTTISSVRELLLSGRTHDSLSDRLEMARQLTNAVYYVHLYSFVHKNIRPETILSLGRTEDAGLPQTAFLTGFQIIRDAQGRTRPVADMRWEVNLYRHPQRWGGGAEYFVMQHDIYSLGVCLLEIGLWESFVAYDGNGDAKPSQTLVDRTHDQAELQDPTQLKAFLVSLSRSSTLRGKMGTKYGKVVETCLTCLDQENVDFGNEEDFTDDDGVTVGVRYIEKVLGALDHVSM